MTTTPGVAVVRLGHGSGLVGVGRERLLAQDVLAGLEGGDGPVPVQAVGERVVDGVDLGVVHQLLVAAHDAGNALLAGEFGGPLAVAGRHGDDRGHPVLRAGLISAVGAMRAAPRIPILSTRRSLGECDPGVRWGSETRPPADVPPLWDGAAAAGDGGARRCMRTDANAPGTRPTLGHIRGLDGIRACRCWRSSPSTPGSTRCPGGFYGVDAFFVLSGFLITSLLVKEWSGTGTIRLRRFWAGRARRLLPALFLLVAVIGMVMAVVPTVLATPHILGDAFSTVFYVSNWYSIHGGVSVLRA